MNDSALNLPDQPDPWKDGDRWDPEDGEAITGTVVERKTLNSERYGTEFEVLVLANGDGNEVDVNCARAHLASLVSGTTPSREMWWRSATGIRRAASALTAMRCVSKRRVADGCPPGAEGPTGAAACRGRASSARLR